MSFGGKFDYAKEYAKYKPESTRFGSYVDEHPDLSAAWKRIENDPGHPDSEYWIKRGATSKEAFGRAHAAEDFALRTGDYHGGASGRTDYMPGTDAWKTLFPGDDPTPRFERWLDTGSSRGNGNGNGGSPAGGGGAPGSTLYPMGLVDYTEPEAMAGIPLAYQPWIQPDHIPDSLWNYQPPTLAEWEVRPGDWSWAEKDVSEYLTDAQRAAQQQQQQQHQAAEGGEDNQGYHDPYPGLFDPTWDAHASNPYASPDYDPVANAALAAQIAAMDISTGVVDTTGLGFDMGETDPVGPTPLGTGEQ